MGLGAFFGTGRTLKQEEEKLRSLRRIERQKSASLRSSRSSKRKKRHKLEHAHLPQRRDRSRSPKQHRHHSHHRYDSSPSPQRMTRSSSRHRTRSSGRSTGKKISSGFSSLEPRSSSRKKKVGAVDCRQTDSNKSTRKYHIKTWYYLGSDSLRRHITAQWNGTV